MKDTIRNENKEAMGPEKKREVEKCSTRIRCSTYLKTSIMSPTVHISYLSQLCIGSRGKIEDVGISIYRDVIVVWDEDHDNRVLAFIEEMFPEGSVRPLAVRESEGTISILWASKHDALFHSQKDDYLLATHDCWSSYHYFIEEGKLKEVEEKEMSRNLLQW